MNPSPAANQWKEAQLIILSSTSVKVKEQKNVLSLPEPSFPLDKAGKVTFLSFGLEMWSPKVQNGKSIGYVVRQETIIILN